jgi:cobalt/nickel transport system permease protein
MSQLSSAVGMASDPSSNVLMHVPDGFINIPTSAVVGVIAAVAVAISIRGARKELDERTAPLAGLVAAFVFAVQMLNFPVAAGTSGHLLGAALAAILVGPYTGVLCLTVVLMVQGIFFADGGLTALGLNVINIAVVGTVAAWFTFKAVRVIVPKSRTGVLIASAVAAFVSVPVAALAFVVEYAIGGTTDVPMGTVLAAMVGTHTLIGIGEAIITTLTVGAVLAARPDLVYGARDLRPTLKVAAPDAITA